MKTIHMTDLISFMAWGDIRARYKRSVLGPLWITLSTAIGVIGLGFIWSELFKIDKASYLPMLTIGLISWQFMSGCITESAGVFSRQAGIIRNLDLPISLQVALLILRHLINLMHNVPLFIIIALFFKTSVNMMTLAVIPNFGLVVANLYWMVLTMGILGARYRDLEYFIGTIMPMLMFFSPVMYRTTSLPFTGEYIWLNPFASMIEIVRYPLLGEATPLLLYLINLGMLAIGGAFSIVLFNAKRNRIAFWV